MTEKELKIEQAAFKTWYIPRLCWNGNYRITAFELNKDFKLNNGLRFAVERDGKLIEVWRKEGKGYVKVI